MGRRFQCEEARCSSGKRHYLNNRNVLCCRDRACGCFEARLNDERTSVQVGEEKIEFGGAIGWIDWRRHSDSRCGEKCGGHFGSIWDDYGDTGRRAYTRCGKPRCNVVDV